MKEIDYDLRQNFLSVDKKVAIDSFGTIFKVGEEVGNEGSDDTAIITEFYLDEDSEEVGVNTTKGKCHLDFIVKK